MPVARIISTSFEDALRFAEYLRPLYDTVEIAQPGHANDTAADLEVNLEICTPEQAWEQIAQFGRQPNSEIFVAPGTLFPEAETRGSPGAEGTTEVQTPAMAPASELDCAGCEVDHAIAQASAAAVTAAGSNGSGTHKAHTAGTVPEEELNWLGRARESLRQWLAIRALLREIRQMQQEQLAQEQKRQRQMALQFERERREQEARELAARAAAQPVPVPNTPPQPELLQVTAFAEQEAIQRRQTEEEELRQQAEQEEAIRRGFFVEQILRRRAAEQSAQAMPAAGSPDGEAVPVDFQAVPEESFASEAQVTPVIRFGRVSRNDRLWPAMTLAGVTSLLLMAVLVGYAHRRPASPVPLSVLQRSNTVEQAVPFGPAIIPAMTPVDMPVTQTAAEALPEAAPLPERHSFRSDFHRVRVDGHEVDYVAADVTVRHFEERSRTVVRHPASAVPISASTRGVKQISDID